MAALEPHRRTECSLTGVRLGNGCPTLKVPYDSEMAATMAFAFSDGYRASQEREVHAYLCGHCGAWHWGGPGKKRSPSQLRRDSLRHAKKRQRTWNQAHERWLKKQGLVDGPL